MLLAESLVIRLNLKMIGLLAILGEKFRRDPDHAGGIEHMNNRMLVFTRDFYRRVSWARGGSSDQ